MRFQGAGQPGENLSVLDAVAIVVGVVVGVGIFKTPSIVASVSDSGAMLLLFWCLGGLLSCIGALCYAELTSTYPHAGGDYHFLRNAYGGAFSFLFAWSRMTVIQTGAIAMIAFLIGDYATDVLRLGPGSNAVYAIATVVLLTTVNILGIKQGKHIQHILVSLILFGVIAAIVASLVILPSSAPVGGSVSPTGAALGTAMIFVLLTYGGWNEAAFISAEVRDKKKNMIKVLLYSIAIITTIYLLINIALMRGLGLEAMAQSQTVVTDLLEKAVGLPGARAATLLILIAALSTVNATIITGARTNYALGADYSLFRFLDVWDQKRHTPVNALLLQGGIAVALILVGAGSKDGFVTMVEYTAPVFWFFFFLTGASLVVLRYRHPERARAFRVPLYPAPPVLFCMACLYMFYSSLAYTGKGAVVGLVVLLTGLPVYLVQKKMASIKETEKGE